MEGVQIALLLLYLADDGSTRMTFTTSENLVECEASADGVRAILTNAGYDIAALRCGETDLVLSPFEHETPDEQMIHRYRITLPSDDGFEVESLSAEDTCVATPDADPAILCAQAGQWVVTP